MEHSNYYNYYSASGFKVFTSASSEWCEIQPGMLISIPYHQLIAPSEEELDHLLKMSGAFGVRFPTNVNQYGFMSKIEICDHYGYDLQYLEHKARNRIQKGMNSCVIRSVSIEELKNDGFRLGLKTMERQKRTDPRADVEYWNKLCDGLEKTDGVKILGAYYQDKLAAYVIILETPTMADMIIQNSDSSLLKYCPNNYLTYYVTWHYLTERSKPLPVFYGLGSVEDTPELDRYKINMGYQLQPIKQRLYFRKDVRRLLRPSLLKMGELINRKFVKGRSYKLDKGCAMLKRYLEQQ